MTGPLAGRVVVEMGGIGPAPFGAMMLAELGAEVIRIDRPESEAGRRLPLHEDLLNRGKKSVVLDLKRAEGVAALQRIVAGADAFIEGFRPGVVERLGLGPEQLLAINPRLVYARMTGWGQTGPLALAAGHDINYIGLTGALHAIGTNEAGPQIPLNLVGDFGGGSTYLVIGILAAMLEAGETGKGQVIDAAIMDGAAHLMTYIYGLMNHGKWQDRREANLLDGGAPYYRIYETACGGHMAVGPIEPKFFATMISLLGLPEGAVDLKRQNDRSYWPDLQDLLARTFASRSRNEWAAVFDSTDACVSPILSMREAAAAPQIAARETIADRGNGRLVPAAAPRFSGHDPQLQRPGPRFGAHSVEILARFGLDGEAFVSQGVALSAASKTVAAE